MWEVRRARRVDKQLQIISADYRNKLESVIKNFKNNPFEGDIEKIKGEENIWRRRVGAYRILYEIFTKERVVLIADIRRRTSTTYK